MKGKNSMAGKRQVSNVRKFTIGSAPASRKAQAKLIIPKVPAEELNDNVDGLVKEAKEAGVEFTHARASVTLY